MLFGLVNGFILMLIVNTGLRLLYIIIHAYIHACIWQHFIIYMSSRHYKSLSFTNDTVLLLNVEMTLKWLYVCACTSIWHSGRVEDETFLGGGNVMVVRSMAFLIALASNPLARSVKLDVPDGSNPSTDRRYNNLMHICLCYISMIAHTWMKLLVLFIINHIYL